MGCVAHGCTGQALSLFCYANAEWLETFCRAALPNLTALPRRRMGVRHTLEILHTGHGVSSLQHNLTLHLYSFLMKSKQQYMWNFVIICCADEGYLVQRWTVFDIYGRKKLVCFHKVLQTVLDGICTCIYSFQTSLLFCGVIVYYLGLSHLI